MLVVAQKPLFHVVLSDGDQCFVEAEWPDGTIEQIDTFGLHIEAVNWLSTQSESWVQGRKDSDEAIALILFDGFRAQSKRLRDLAAIRLQFCRPAPGHQVRESLPLRKADPPCRGCRSARRNVYCWPKATVSRCSKSGGLATLATIGAFCMVSVG